MPSKKQTTTPTNNKITLPKGWEWVRFGDVVRNVNATCTNPIELGLERFVGLEHLEPRDLRIRTWGNIKDGTTFTRLFRAGQVLFGKRRAYQRKAAIANFDGLCSSDIYVFAANAGRLIPDLLPFLVQAEGFAKHAENTSEGSLSPRTKWKYLAEYEFALPTSLNEQRRIAELLRAADDAVEAWREVKEAIKLQVESVLHESWKGAERVTKRETAIGSLPKHWRVVRFGDLVEEYAYGPRFSSELYTENGNCCSVRTSDFDRVGGINFMSKMPWATLDTSVIQKHKLQSGDFLLSRSGEYAGLTAVFESELSHFLPAAFVIRYRLKQSEIDSHYVAAVCHSEFGKKYIGSLATGSAQPNIAGSAVLEIPFPIPPRQEQEEIVVKWKELKARQIEIQKHTETLLRTLVRISSTLFTPPEAQ